MSDDGYDLLSRPWVRVRAGREVREVSLTEAFSEAHRLTALAGEVPTQDAAMLRVMLAVLHRSLAGPGYPPDLWRDLWDAPVLPMDRIGGYLAAHASRFELFHPISPFLQSPELTASKTSGLVKLIADVPDGERLFTTRAGRNVETMGPGEAARWLVHAHAYDVSGIKTGAIGDDRVKGGRGYPIGTGWAGRCGLVVLEGSSLRETLLLNLVLRPVSGTDVGDLPVWERAVLGPTVERGHPEPTGPADLMTWPVRRIRLVREGEAVVEVLLCNGDPIHPRNRHDMEQMSGFRRSANQEKTHGAPVYMPARHDPSRALWRGLTGVLAQSGQASSRGNEAEMVLPPANITWLDTLLREGAVAPDCRVRVRAIGMTYGTQDASIEAIFDDSLTMAAAVASDEQLRSAALRASAAGEAAVRALGDLASNLALASGRAPDGPREAARVAGFSLLGREFEIWLSTLTPAVDVADAEQRWQIRARSLVDGLAWDAATNAGEAAWVGREHRGRQYDSSLAWRWYRVQVARALTYGIHAEEHQPTTEEGT